jgi:ABC-type transport system involved in multi-copper enzyme maturation permease subunit
MINIWEVARLTFEEAWRRFVAVAALGLGAIFVILYALGLNLISSSMRSRSLSAAQLELNYSILLLAGLYVVHFLAIALTIFSSAASISGEISSYTIQALVTKPVRRWQILAGKWLGLAFMLLLYVGLLSSGLVLVTYWLTGYLTPNPLEGLLTIMLEIVVLLSASLLGSTFLATLTNGIVLFMLYGLAFAGGWIEQVAAFAQVQGVGQIGVVTSLVLPVEALWRRAAFLMQPPFLRDLPVTPFSPVSVPSPAMLLYAAIYSLVMFGLAVRVFSRRDL